MDNFCSLTQRLQCYFLVNQLVGHIVVVCCMVLHVRPVDVSFPMYCLINEVATLLCGKPLQKVPLGYF